MYVPEATNSRDIPETLGQVSVFQSPHHPEVLLADIAVSDYRNVLGWYAIPHESHCYEAAIQDYKDGVLNLVNYSFYLEYDPDADKVRIT